MRLFPPKQLNEKLNEQKKSEVDAGLFLAKKIDALRENLAEEQNKHDIAIDSMKQEFIIFSGEQSAKKGNLEKEIKDLEVIRESLQKPLDDAWSDFHQQNDEFSVKLEKLQEREYIASQKEIEIGKKNEQSDKLHLESIQSKIQTDENLRRAENILKSRQAEGKDFLNRKEAWERQKIKEEKDIERRKIEADLLKKEYEKKVENITEKERLIDLKIVKHARNRWKY